MKTFYSWSEVPSGFDGHCYIILERGHFYMKSKGRKYGFINYHRLYGPAVQYDDGRYKAWYIEGKEYTEEQFWNHPSVIENKLKEILKEL